MDPKSAALFRELKDQKFFEPDSASGLLLREIAEFRRSLQLGKNDICTLGMVGVHFQRDPNVKADATGKPLVQRYCILKGECIAHLTKRDNEAPAGADGARRDDDLPGVSIVVVKDAGTDHGKIVAEIHLSFLVHKPNRTEVLTRSVFLTHNKDWRWRVQPGRRLKQD